MSGQRKAPLCDQPKWNNLRHRCCCVFDHDSDEDQPLAECHYHELRSREIERLRNENFELRLMCANYRLDGRSALDTNSEANRVAEQPPAAVK